MMEYYNDKLKEGFEGIMIKRLNGEYEYKRSDNWMKLKPVIEEDLKIVNIEEGTGKYENMLGAFVCELSNKNLVNVGSGFKEEDRENFWKNKNKIIGKIAEIRFQEKTKDGSLRFPVFVRFRDDK